MKLLITGGAGFIGSNLVHYLLRERPDWDIVVLDLLTYAGSLENLREAEGNPRYSFVQGDVCDPSLVREVMEGADGVLNLAAESHVDRSIQEPAPFIRTNVLGTQVLLDAAREAEAGRFLQVSTDEVYGELPWVDPETGLDETGTPVPPPVPKFTETSPLNPRSPYSASKAAADLLALSYRTTFNLDVVIARGSNNFGPRQHPEKLIPLMVTYALEGKPLPVYGDGLHVRDWIYVEDFCRGILAAFQVGHPGEVYNFGGDAERTNLRVVHGLLDALDADPELITFVEDRKGHDRRYSMDLTKVTLDLGWKPKKRFEEDLRATARWYVENRGWWISSKTS
jgi:dTDP-glucose 4,6-dehydratase